jgi:thioredoxin reductase (NADPH)
MLSTANLKSALAKHPQLSVTLLYAAVDIVSGLNQIAVSVGQAAIAATAVHNHLPPHRHSGSSGESKAGCV